MTKRAPKRIEMKCEDEDWETIGEVCVDSARLIICDPCRAAAASTVFIHADIDFNELAIKGIRSHQLRRDSDPLAVVVETGLGDGMYKVEACYEDLSEWGRRIAEIRIKFLPHPQLEGEE